MTTSSELIKKQEIERAIDSLDRDDSHHVERLRALLQQLTAWYRRNYGRPTA